MRLNAYDLCCAGGGSLLGLQDGVDKEYVPLHGGHFGGDLRGAELQRAECHGAGEHGHGHCQAF